MTVSSHEAGVRVRWRNDSKWCLCLHKEWRMNPKFEGIYQTRPEFSSGVLYVRYIQTVVDVTGKREGCIGAESRVWRVEVLLLATQVHISLHHHEPESHHTFRKKNNITLEKEWMKNTPWFLLRFQNMLFCSTNFQFHFLTLGRDGSISTSKTPFPSWFQSFK